MKIRSIKSAGLVPVLLSLMICSVNSIAENQEQVPQSNFLWALLEQKAAEPVRIVDFSRTVIELTSVSNFKLYIKPVTNVYVYILLNDAKGNFYLVFPRSLKSWEADYQYGREYFIPEGDNWFYPDGETGLEQFILIAAVKRLFDLEDVLEKYHITACSSGCCSFSSVEAGERIRYEIKKIKSSINSFISAPGKPVPLAGSFRGLPGSVIGQVQEVKVPALYIRTFYIRH